MTDDDQDEQVSTGDEPSRSQLKREAQAVFELAERLVATSAAELARLPLSEELRDLVERSRRVTQQIARKRQLQYLAKQMRRRSEELPALREALERDQALARRESAALHRLEAWRERLIADGDPALELLLAQCPGLDRQQLRQLIRRARLERERSIPPSAGRELFRLVRQAFDEQAP
jgi:ribosome-associated protein